LKFDVLKPQNHPATHCLWNVINSVNSEFQQKKTEHQAMICVRGCDTYLPNFVAGTSDTKV